MSVAARTVELAPELASVRTGRYLVRDTLLEWGLDELVDDAQLATSELVANAVTYARTGVVVSMTLDDQVTVTVRDDADDLPISTRRSGAAAVSAVATSGRGLQIVEAISDSWGVSADGAGKSVWFTMRLPDDHSRDADVVSLDRQREAHSQAAPAPESPSASGHARAAL